MLIAIDASRANKQKKTGVEWYSYHLIEELKKIDRDNRYFLYTNKKLNGALGECPPNFVEKILSWPIPRSWTIARLSWEMRPESEKGGDWKGRRLPDVLFVPAHTIPLINPACSIVTVHDIGFEHFPEVYHWANKLYHKLIIRFIKKSAAKIIAVSNFTKEDLVLTYKINPDKITVIYNGYDAGKFKVIPSAKNYLREKFSIDYPFFLFIGRVEHKKNILRLISAFNIYKKKNADDIRKLVIIGIAGIDDAYRRALAKIEELNLENDVVFLGWLGDDDLPYFYNAADLFVFPSLFEGFGIPVIEAMASGCPVICSDSTSLPEVAGNAALMFDPMNCQDIADKMETAGLNQDIRLSLINKGLERVKMFSWRKCAEETLKAIVDK